MSDTIFISVPSVRDQEIFNIVEQAFDEADSPDDIHIGICHSIPFNNTKEIQYITNRIIRKNVCQKFVNLYRNVGVGYGRLHSASLYAGQDYFLQIDGHTNFEKSWDSQVLDMYKSIPPDMKGDKAILTAYLPRYQIIQNNERVFPEGKLPRYCSYVSKGQEDQGIPSNQAARKPSDPNVPMWLATRSVEGGEPGLPPYRATTDVTINDFYNFILTNGYFYARKISANFFFSVGSIVDDYSKIYDWGYLFWEEEFISSIQAHSLGYNLIFPHFELPLTHLYADSFNEFYNEKSRRLISPDHEQEVRAQKKTRKYLTDRENQDKIIRYCEYAGLSYPEFESVDTFYIPGEKNA